jgi:hypothetical protein
MLPEIHALWIGTRLSEMTKCCLKSFVMRGHSVYLHVYENMENIPTGVTCVDANLIIPKDKIFKHKDTGSFALFSDIFRFELLKRVDCIYVDCDVYCLKPIELPKSGYLLGYESDSVINGAILKLPQDSEILNTLLEITHDPYFIPEWVERSVKKKLKFKKIFGPGVHISEMPWGVLGPTAITYYVNKLCLKDKVQPIDVFYPVHYSCIHLLLDPDLTIDDLVTSRTQCIHLFNEMFRKLNSYEVPEQSVLGKMFRNEI